MKGLRESLLAALLFLATAELLRANGPLLDNVAGSIGIIPAAAVAVGLFILPGALLAAMRRSFLPGMIALLILVRLTAQLAPNLPLAGAGAVLGLICLAVAVQRAADPVVAATGLLIGGLLDLGLRAATTTWDPIWTGLWGLPMVLAPAIAFFLSLLLGDPDDRRSQGRAWMVGAYLALWTTTIGNPAFFSRVRLQLAIFIAMLGVLLSIELVRRVSLRPFVGTVALAGGIAGTAAAWWGSGWTVIAGVVAAQAFSAVSITRAFAAPASGRRGSWLLGLAWVLPVLLYQLHYEIPLPFDNRYLLVAVSVLIGLTGVGRREAPAPQLPEPEPDLPPGMLPVHRITPRPLWAVTVALVILVLLPLGYLTIKPGDAPVERGNSLRVLSWNVKYGRDDATGRVDPAQIAAVIRAQQVDLVLLQEVSRGWTIGGGLDLAEWLARDLGMAFYWAPAADEQFGNLVLAPKGRRLSVEHQRLPYGQGPMWRSFLRFEVDGIDFVATHLTHRKQNTPTRVAQIRTILEDKPDIVVGDLNFWPSWDERTLFDSAGYFSAQDITGNGALFTSPTARPTNRVDWVWGSRRVEFVSFRVVSDAKGSDHFPLVFAVTSR